MVLSNRGAFQKGDGVLEIKTRWMANCVWRERIALKMGRYCKKNEVMWGKMKGWNPRGFQSDW